jgi:hypothetical protein
MLASPFVSVGLCLKTLCLIWVCHQKAKALTGLMAAKGMSQAIADGPM